MASETEICNRGLQKLGAARITSLTQDSENARDCNVVYEPLRDKELRAHEWSFAKTRAKVAATTNTPAFGFDYEFEFPSDCLRIVKVLGSADDDDEMEDYTIEGRKILTNQSGPLYLVYTKQVADPNQMDVLFREALSAAIAYELCEKITQSNTKKVDAERWYEKVIAQARQVNSIEKPPKKPPADEWVTVRR